MHVWTAKVLVLLGMFVMTFLSSLAPIKFNQLAQNDADPRRRRRYLRAISFLSCFAAGVFLATCLLDLFPEVRRQIEHAFSKLNVVTSFPVGEFIMVIGLFVILIVEQTVLFIKESRSRHETENMETDPLLVDSGLCNDLEDSWSKKAYRSMSQTSSLSQGISDHPRTGAMPSHCANNSDNDGESNTRDIQQSPSTTHGHSHSHSHSMEPELAPHSPIRAFVLVLALSLHSVFEGLAVGLQPKVDDVIEIFSALVLHKCILAFSLGLNLVQSQLSLAVIVRSNLLFSITSPVGIAIGIGVIDLTSSAVSGLTNGILQGLACGTFLYVTFFEVLPHEFNSSDDRPLKLLFLVLGFSAVCALIFLHPDKDSPVCGNGSVGRNKTLLQIH